MEHWKQINEGNILHEKLKANMASNAQMKIVFKNYS